MKLAFFIFSTSLVFLTECSAMSKEQLEEYHNQFRLNKIKSRYDEIQMLCASLISQIHKQQPTPSQSFERIFNLADDLEVNIPLCHSLDANMRRNIEIVISDFRKIRPAKHKK